MSIGFISYAVIFREFVTSAELSEMCLTMKFPNSFVLTLGHLKV